MTATSRGCRFRLPRPKTFLGLMSLQTGTELVSLALVFNKATGIYGLLALFTGYVFSALQLSMYILSVLALLSLAYCIPHIRKRPSHPFENLALAWLYTLDTAVNTVYTSVFAVTWYLASAHDPKGPAGGAETPDDASPSDGDVKTKAGAGVQETATSIALIIAFTLVRIYFSLVVMAHARMVLHRYVGEQEQQREDDDHPAGGVKNSDGLVPDVFAVGAPLGDGLKGRLGRIMVLVGRSYWLGGRKEDEEWARDVGSRFGSGSGGSGSGRRAGEFTSL
ncbi:Inositolphosphorylceramide synthase subunit Kei1-domain-containing protein [Bombardia bombarda]|uniref:Inositolphosphorylceramide synthase subunit Kei1-domain-containing protein n=1 Tax=Bombardia bombarda TaxID=252184 RepID=A0AA39XQ58_9PEZI|nr:Inositolphosphorylceramide synthase subunit Kei1-domain-containing protein [Bombardia bombarda]